MHTNKRRTRTREGIAEEAKEKSKGKGKGGARLPQGTRRGSAGQLPHVVLGVERRRRAVAQPKALPRPALRVRLPAPRHHLRARAGGPGAAAAPRRRVLRRGGLDGGRDLGHKLNERGRGQRRFFREADVVRVLDPFALGE